jgi:PAS domain S-box-containing protein
MSIVLLIAIAIAAVSTIAVFFFKREVNRKTRSLMHAQTQFKRLVDNLPGAVFRSCRRDGEWYLEYVSDATERLVGYPASEFIGAGNPRFREIVHPEDLALIDRVCRESSSGPFRRFEIDFRIIAKDGTTRWLHARGTSLTDDGIGNSGSGHSTEITTLDGIVLDITEQKRVADLLTQQQSKMASSARLSALGEMAGGIAHEINNPLAIINLRTHQLSQLAEKGDVRSRDALTIAQGIESTSIRISKIIKSLQTVARESEHDPFERVPLKAIIGDAFELCYQRMKKHGIDVIVDEFPGEIEVDCKRVQISQVLINLLNNAFDAVVNLPQRYIRISARDLGALVEIAIEDSGGGIQPAVAEKIFQPFYTTKGVGKGTGLGLSISKGMIETHGGEIWLDTDALHTRFVLTLPKQQRFNVDSFGQEVSSSRFGAKRNASQPELTSV